MNLPKPKILIVDDETDILDSLELTFEEDYDVLTATGGPEALALLGSEPVAVIVSDQRMPGMTGAAFLRQTVEIAPKALRIMLTGYSDMEALVEAVNDGRIHKYITKPWSPDELKQDIQRAVESHEMALELERRHNRIARLNRELEEAKQKLELENIQLRHVAKERSRFDGLIGQSPAMERVYTLVEKVLDADTSVMLTGETGTGKELLARCIHFNGSRKDDPFVAQNCGALPENLLESELFGHKRGAFTGAVENRPGLFEAADGGTVFLDEIGDTTPALQVRLLRVLQEGEIRRVGESADRKVDVRVIAATNRDLLSDVSSGRFREDLYYRLNVFPIHTPSLSERPEDIPLLAAHFLAEYAPDREVRISAKAMDHLCRYDWPGNVRELENEIQRGLLLASDSDRIEADHLSETVRGEATTEPRTNGSLKSAVGQLERDMISDALKRHNGNRTHAARALGVSRWGLVQKIQRLGIGKADS